VGNTVHFDAFFVMPTHRDIFCEETENGKQAGQRPPTPNFVQQLIAIHVFIVPQVVSNFWLVARLCVDLDHSIDNAVEAFVLIER
jgi:hypothetical protein